jgi:hypothetical protein
MVFWWRSALWLAWSPVSSLPASTISRSPPGSGISCTRTPPRLPSPFFSSHSALCWPPQSSAGCYAGYSAASGWADRVAGGAFGLLKGYIVVALGVAAMAAFFPRQPWFDQSQLVPYFFPGAHGSATVLPQDLGVRIQSGLHSLENVARREASGLGQHY